MNSSETTTLRVLLGVVAGLVLAGCAAAPTAAKPEDAVQQRASTRAQAFVKGDFEGSYGFTAPSYRKLRTLDAYKRTIGSSASWEKAEVKGVACQPERCTVSLSVGVKPLMAGRFGDTITVQFEEIWLLEDGNWWLHQGL